MTEPGWPGFQRLFCVVILAAYVVDAFHPLGWPSRRAVQLAPSHIPHFVFRETRGLEEVNTTHETTLRHEEDDSITSLRLLSMNPPLWVTTEPILTPDECDLLSNHLNEQERNDKAQDTLSSLQERLDRFICRAGPPVMPRLLEYEPTDEGYDSVEAVLPDGLHVDTADDGGSSSRRFLSVIVYLTDTDSAATNFPLAVPLQVQPRRGGTATIDEPFDDDDSDSPALEAARFLIDADVQHTEWCSSDKEEQMARVLERAAFMLHQQSDSEAVVVSSNGCQGLRILPRQGHFVAFSFVEPATGMVNPRSWHSSEALLPGHEKRVLTFFYKVPNKTHDAEELLTPCLAPIEFGKCVQEALQPMFERFGHDRC